MNAYTTITEWENHDGIVTAYNELGQDVITIDALQNKWECAKWGEKYLPGRGWTVRHEDGTETRGRSRDLREAKGVTTGILTVLV